tara:strand:- start:374 stop:826 length:453 start_codon:yes stop_codon:yes gene_type:complete
MNSIQGLIDKEKQNPDLESTLDVSALLSAAEKVSSDFLNNHTLSSISHNNFLSIQPYVIHEKLHKILNKLHEYYHIDYVYQIHKGKHVRWLRNGILTNGGIVVDIKFLDTGTHILCKCGKQFIQYKFDECITFQRLSTDEMMILQLKSTL